MKLDKLKSLQKYIEYALLVFAVLAAALFLNRYVSYTLDSDAASELMLGKLMAERGDILFSKDWCYSTELRVLYSQLIYAPLFRLGLGWHAIRVIGTVTMQLLLALSVIVYCRAVGARRWAVLTAVLMLLPLSELYYRFYLKFAYYTPNAIIAFLVAAALLKYGGREIKKGIVPLMLGALLSFLAGLGGFRLILTLFIPLCMTLLLRLWQSWEKRSREELRLLFTGFFYAAAAMAGLLVNTKVLSQIYMFEDYTVISTKLFSLEGFENVLGGIMQCLGFVDKEKLFGPALIFCAVGVGIFALSVYSALYILRHKDSFSVGEYLAAGFYLCSALALCLVYAFTYMHYYVSYSFPAAILSLPPIFICFGKKGVLGRAFIFALCLACLISGALNYNNMRRQDDMAGFRQVTEYLKDSEYKKGLAPFWNANVLTELSEGELEMWICRPHWLEVRVQNVEYMHSWLQLKSHISNPPEGKVFILLSSNEDNYHGACNFYGEENLLFRCREYMSALKCEVEYSVYGFDSFDEVDGKIEQWKAVNLPEY